jgi:V8-like Glu-specific endopeptidase
LKSLFILLFAVVGADAWAFPKAPFNALERPHYKSTRELSESGYDFEGIVKLSNCSGSLIAFNGQPLSAKALVMTNGHCIQKPGGFLAPGEHWFNRPISRKMKLYDRAFKLHEIEASKIVYATMTNTDIAFYELTESYNQILARTKVRPLLLDTAHPLSGVSIEIISGYWDRGYSCEIDGFVYKIREGEWTFKDSIRYTSGCDTIGGTSGSPILAKGERRVIGINNTSNESGKRCELNNPCEVSEAGEIRATKGVRYGQQTFQTYSCLTPDFRIDLKIPGCELPH